MDNFQQQNPETPKKYSMAMEEILHSKLFLIYAIFVSAVAFANLLILSVGNHDAASTIFALPGLACASVSTVGVWLIFSCKGKIEAKKLRLTKTLMTFEYVIYIIILVCVCIAAVAVMVAFGILASNSSVIENSTIAQAIDEANKALAQQGVQYTIPTDIDREFLSTFGYLMIAVTAIVAAIAIALLSIAVRVFSRSSKYWAALAQTAETGYYCPGKVPTKLLVFWGVMTGIFAVFSLSSFISFLSGAAMAGTLFVQGKLFRKIHETEMKLDAAPENEWEGYAAPKTDGDSTNGDHSSVK